jgi:hypothetical protein
MKLHIVFKKCTYCAQTVQRWKSTDKPLIENPAHTIHDQEKATNKST